MSVDSSDQETTTVDYEEIKAWVERRDGTPARVTDEGGAHTDLGMDGFLFAFLPEGKRTTEVPETDEKHIEEISWSRFFEKFEEENLAFRYRESAEDERPSDFYTFVDRNISEVEGGFDEVLEDSVLSQAATSTAEVEPGMDVIDVSQGKRKIGMVSEVAGSRIHVDLDPGLIDKMEIELGWGDDQADEDVFAVSENEIESVDGDEVRIYRTE